MSKKIALHTGIEVSLDELLSYCDAANKKGIDKMFHQDSAGEIIIRNLISRIKELEEEIDEYQEENANR